MTWQLNNNRGDGVHRWSDIRTRRVTRAPLPANSYGHWNATVRANAKTGASWSANGSRSTRVRLVASRRCATCPTDQTVGPRLRRLSYFVLRYCSCSRQPSSISCSCRRPQNYFPLPRPPSDPLPTTCHLQTQLGWPQKSINILYFYRRRSITCSPRGLSLSKHCRYNMFFPKKKKINTYYIYYRYLFYIYVSYF